MIKARATSFGEEYDYCRVCKKELSEMQPKLSDAPESEVYKALNNFLLHGMDAWHGTKVVPKAWTAGASFDPNTIYAAPPQKPSTPND